MQSKHSRHAQSSENIKRLLFVALITVLIGGVSVSLLAQQIVDPEKLAQQAEQERLAAESGYGDIEIDNLHRELAAVAAQLKGYYQSEVEIQETELGEKPDIVLPIAFGESIKAIDERYIYDGDIRIFLTADDKLAKVEFAFVRTNPLGTEYKEEKRTLTNPTPNYAADGEKTIDRNDDYVIIYYEKTDPDKGFEKVREMNTMSIPFFDKRIRLIETYKKYTRRALRLMEKKSTDLDLHQRVQIQHMLEFE